MMVNVGWLAYGHAFPTGQTSEECHGKLEQRCLRHVKQTRGFYSCDFCKSKKKPHRSAEIRVAGKGRVYAAPELVCHYVLAHAYKPPEEFIAAVLAGGR